jgi:hypothetical protein
LRNSVATVAQSGWVLFKQPELPADARTAYASDGMVMPA